MEWNKQTNKQKWNIRTALSGSASIANVRSQVAVTSSGEDLYLQDMKKKDFLKHRFCLYINLKTFTGDISYFAPNPTRGSHLLLVRFHTVTSHLTTKETKVETDVNCIVYR